MKQGMRFLKAAAATYVVAFFKVINSQVLANEQLSHCKLIQAKLLVQYDNN